MVLSIIEVIVLFVLIAGAFGGIVAYFFYMTREQGDTKPAHKDKKGAGKRP